MTQEQTKTVQVNAELYDKVNKIVLVKKLQGQKASVRQAVRRALEDWIAENDHYIEGL